MKTDINLTLNKLLNYAFDNLLLDALDETYTLNRLAALCGVKSPERDADADYGDAALGDLLDELKAAAPSVDKGAVFEVLFPLPHTVNMYFCDTLARSKDKAFDFLFDLYAHGHNITSNSAAVGKDGYLAYHNNAEKRAAVTLSVGDDDLVYSPMVVGNRIAALENLDVIADDVVAREVAYVTNYGGAIATRVDGKSDYLCCDGVALGQAPVKTQVSSGTAKVALLDYPVPVLAVSGIAKNAVTREAARLVKAATDNGLNCVVAATAKDGVTVYIVFANDVKPDANNILAASDALTVCGVFATVDCTPVLGVLEKGTALSTDLAPFKSIYDVVGGVKLGAKALGALGEALVNIFKPALAAAASTTEDKATALVSA